MVYLPHLRPAVTVARMLATLNAAGLAGRFTFGAGVGGDIPAEFDAVGLDIARRGLALDLSLESIRACFEADAGFSDHGPFPPLWLGGRSIKALHRALRLGSGFAPYLVTLDQYRALRQEIPATAVQAGFKTAVLLLIAVDTARSPGREAASRAKPFSLPPHLLDRHLITGPAPECARQLSAYAAAGVDHIILNLAVPPESKHEQLELIAQEVVPLLRDHHPPRQAAAQSTIPRS
jgi:alkanesulfonate monooxygenase SsuD/methylene tetrahydromethanopterin reductase-like flavin-dependent oxidoreductase (luciferase family)